MTDTIVMTTAIRNEVPAIPNNASRGAASRSARLSEPLERNTRLLCRSRTNAPRNQQNPVIANGSGT